MDSKTRTAVIVPSLRPRAIHPRLVMLQGPDIGRQIELGDEAVQIGRGEEANLRVESDLISRKHAIIQRAGGAYLIQDQGSTNGTYVNNEKIGTKNLEEGDLIKVGKVVLRYTESDVEAQYHEQIREQARVDAMTGAFNKRHFDETFKPLVSQCLKIGRPLALVIFDVDHFKKINDTYGHLAGDTVLSRIGDAVRTEINTEIFSRVGGEEFTIIAPGGTIEVIRALAERIRRRVEGTVFQSEGRTIPVTISLGVSSLEEAKSADALYRFTDARLYEAKHSGRNRVC